MTAFQIWFLPTLIVGLTIALAIPLGFYMARLMDGRLTLPRWLSAPERLLDTGPQGWKAYAVSFLAFNVMCFIVGFAVLALQPQLPLNPDDKAALAPTTIFNTACSFLTNTNLQHYSGEVHLSYFSQLFFICWKQMITPVLGLAALAAIIRGLRGDAHMGNFYVDLWRGVVFLMLPLSLIVGTMLIAGGVPMTLDGAAKAVTFDGSEQTIARGPVAAIVAIKQLGTNGGGYFGANSAHPFENPSAFTNVVECVCIILIPVAAVVMFGRMLGRMREAAVVGGVMLAGLVGLIGWGIWWDTLQPNPGLAGLPVDQSLGNLEGKELRFGTSAGATWSAVTTCTSNGSVNAMHDSLNPLAGLTPLSGMWINAFFGGVGVGFINMLIYIITGVFLAGLMVGRTPEYLGKKVEAREMKLAMLALLIHPILVLGPTGLFAAKGWADAAKNNPGPHGFSETLYEFTSASANNGSGFEGLADTVGFAADDHPEDKKVQRHWDIATGLVMLLGRFIPIIAPLALAASLAAKKRTPQTSGTLRTDTATFSFVLAGTILLVGALLFLPAAVLGPVAEHLGPMPFGGATP